MFKRANRKTQKEKENTACFQKAPTGCESRQYIIRANFVSGPNVRRRLREPMEDIRCLLPRPAREGRRARLRLLSRRRAPGTPVLRRRRQQRAHAERVGDAEEPGEQVLRRKSVAKVLGKSAASSSPLSKYELMMK